MMDNTIKKIIFYLESCNNKNNSGESSLPLSLIILSTLPMVYFTDLKNFKQIRITIMLLINIFIRLLYPSSYYPATQSKPGILYHPLTARLIAFIAEFGLYEIWANWINQCFWDNNLLWIIVLIGEMISTFGVIIQSELLLNFEDIVWTLHTFYMCYLSYPDIETFFFGSFGFYLVFFYLPKRIELLYTRKRCIKKGASIFYINPLYCYKGKIQECSLEEKSWVIPMLLSQPLLTAFMYYCINK